MEQLKHRLKKVPIKISLVKLELFTLLFTMGKTSFLIRKVTLILRLKSITLYLRCGLSLTKTFRLLFQGGGGGGGGYPWKTLVHRYKTDSLESSPVIIDLLQVLKISW